MNRSLVALGVLAASAFLIPDDAVAQRGGAGFRGSAPSFRSGGGPAAFRPPMGGAPQLDVAGPHGFGSPVMAARPRFRGGAVGIRPSGSRPAIGWLGYRGYSGHGWSYPFYGGALLAGLTLGALSYPYYGYGYDYPYRYSGVSFGGDCYWIQRRVIDPWGRVVRRLVQVCEY